MPLVQVETPSVVSSQHHVCDARSCADLQRALFSMNAGDRRQAALNAVYCKASKHALLQAVAKERHLAVREAMFDTLMHVVDAEVVEAVLPMLRSNDAMLRNAVIELLQQRSSLFAPHAEALLQDADTDTRIFAVNVIQHLSHPMVPNWLIQVVAKDGHVNVVAAAVNGLLDVVRADMRPTLESVKTRFPKEPYLHFAVDMVLQRGALSKSLDETGITDGEFATFCGYFYHSTGILFKDAKRYFVDQRLIDRMKATHHDSFQSYFSFLRLENSQKAKDELQALINIMTVNETYFFREDAHFKVMVGDVLAQIVATKRKGEKIRIWSVPSSTGEEPYSIAMYLLEHWPQLQHWNVEILASDINSEVIERCMKGVYNKHALRYTPDGLLKKYFRQRADGDYQIDYTLRKSISFFLGSVLEADALPQVKGVDLIYCRNMLIYFDDAARKKVADVFYSVLNPNGFVFLGGMESMSRISSLFHVERFGTTLGYRRGDI